MNKADVEQKEAEEFGCLSEVSSDWRRRETNQRN